VLSSSSLFATSSNSAGDVYSWCAEPENSNVISLRYARCGGYIVGVYDHSINTTLTDHVCLSSGITPKQLIKIFTAYIDRNPQYMHLTASSVIEFAIIEAFSCEK